MTKTYYTIDIERMTQLKQQLDRIINAVESLDSQTFQKIMQSKRKLKTTIDSLILLATSNEIQMSRRLLFSDIAKDLLHIRLTLASITNINIHNAIKGTLDSLNIIIDEAPEEALLSKIVPHSITHTKCWQDYLPA